MNRTVWWMVAAVTLGWTLGCSGLELVDLSTDSSTEDGEEDGEVEDTAAEDGEEDAEDGEEDAEDGEEDAEDGEEDAEDGEEEGGDEARDQPAPSGDDRTRRDRGKSGKGGNRKGIKRQPQ